MTIFDILVIWKLIIVLSLANWNVILCRGVRFLEKWRLEE